MPYRTTPTLRLVPDTPSHDHPDPLNAVSTEPGAPGWVRIEVWRRGDLVGEGSIRREVYSDSFITGLAAYYLHDPTAVIYGHRDAAKTGS